MSPALDFLSQHDADFAPLIQRIGPPRLALRLDREPYEALVRGVAFQQLHGKAAAAILARLVALTPDQPFPTPAQLNACPEADLRGCGLSAAKVAAIKDIAANAEAGLVPDLAAAQDLSDEVLIERLTRLRGVGRWTVEMLLIFGLGRPDILPVGDFAVRQGYRKWKNLDVAPTPGALAEIGRGWSPYRSTAAWYLWRASEFKP